MIPFYAKHVTYALESVLRNFSYPWRHSELAVMATYSVSCFSRVFKQVVGEPFKQFYVRKRMERALRILHRKPGISIADTAHLLGYKHWQNFSISFSDYYGYSPYAVKTGKANPVKRVMVENFKSTIRFEEIGMLPEKVVLYDRLYGSYQTDTIYAKFKEVYDYAINNGHTVTQFMGIRHDDPLFTDANNCIYDVCVAVNSPEKRWPKYLYNMKTVKDKHLYAIFLFEGYMDELEAAWNFISNYWVEESSYEHKISEWVEIFLPNEQDATNKKGKAKLFLPLEQMDS